MVPSGSWPGNTEKKILKSLDYCKIMAITAIPKGFTYLSCAIPILGKVFKKITLIADEITEKVTCKAISNFPVRSFKMN